uniref:GP-PDE domain-containing protein n=1 Tax=Chromera velia CCMP2878 TaxID=1169474 RepID=A0A0G4IFQ2_9ALVE|eukprot:Cvel_13995.t1-p1 / transcript=Cvel_13995.t1 / gene=Cvel_13995 / organism=Chromera_velia_CCMP2878 / gene_product=Glycerophosphodiester phosphodiesterase, putative / transcript_product=Glycerophosphodiester phosphodiesterase, putative / location=Cvel_scaffold978:51002-54978(-) / protein_length=405 / sequence_SO=supercontig / SO=protein_coding / is_pseudo=false
MLGGTEAQVALLVGVTAYMSLSLLRRFPLLLHRRKEVVRGKSCRHISHRGGAYEQPENSVRAFSYALEKCKTNMLELDVWSTKDGQVVVSHDRFLPELSEAEGKYTGEKKDITQTPLQELPMIAGSDQLVPPVQYLEVDKTFTWPDDFPPCPMPLLKELFEKFLNVPMAIDIKQRGCEETVQRVLRMVDEYNRKPITILNSFHDENISLVLKHDKQALTGAAPREVLSVYLLYALGLLPLFPIRSSVLTIPHPSCSWAGHEAEKACVSVCKKFPSSLHPLVTGVVTSVVLWASRQLVNPGLFNHLKARGLLIFFWVCNTRASIEAAFRDGADGVMSDRPSLLREVLDDIEELGAVGGPKLERGEKRNEDCSGGVDKKADLTRQKEKGWGKGMHNSNIEPKRKKSN